MKYKKWSLKEKLEILACSEEVGIVETCRKYGVSTGTFYAWKKKFDQKGEAGLKVTYDGRSKDLKQAEEQIRVLRKLLCDKEVELEVQRELLKKKVWDVRSKKDLVDRMHAKHKISKTKLIDMVGMVHSSYYRKATGGRKGNKPSKFTYHSKRGLVSQNGVIESVKSILKHPFIDCGYRLMTSYLKR